MKSQPDVSYQSHDLLLFIVNHGQAAKFVNYAREHGAAGASIIQGCGTRRNFVLEMLGIDEVHRELIIMIVPHSLSDHLLDQLNARFEMEKPGHGVAVSVPLNYVLGLSPLAAETERPDSLRDDHVLVMAIVDHGNGDQVVTLASEEGATGATLIKARGTAHFQKKTFDFPIEPEKDLVVMILERAQYPAVTEKIHESLKFDQPNSGIQYMMPIERAVGLFRTAKPKRTQPASASDANGLTSNQYTRPTVDNQLANRQAEETRQRYCAIHLITSPELIDTATELAIRQGALGATHLAMRGAGKNRLKKIFNVPIEWRREMLILITPSETTAKIARAINDTLDLSQPGQGIIFITDLAHASGLAETSQSE